MKVLRDVVDLSARFLSLLPPVLEAEPEPEPLPGSRPPRPIQRQIRLGEEQVIQLVASYLDGTAVRDLAEQFEVQKKTGWSP